jgi:hypothetical protein
MYHPTETASLKNKYYMAVHSRLNAFSFDISLIEIGQESV